MPSTPDRSFVVQKPIVSLLLLPPPASVPVASERGETDIPILKLPADFKPVIIPYASLKSAIGRVLDRVLGYFLSILTLLGAGSAMIGVGNFVLGMTVLTFWKKNAGAASGV